MSSHSPRLGASLNLIHSQISMYSSLIQGTWENNREPGLTPGVSESVGLGRSESLHLSKFPGDAHAAGWQTSV